MIRLASVAASLGLVAGAACDREPSPAQDAKVERSDAPSTPRVEEPELEPPPEPAVSEAEAACAAFSAAATKAAEGLAENKRKVNLMTAELCPKMLRDFQAKSPELEANAIRCLLDHEGFDESYKCIIEAEAAFRKGQ